VIGRVGEAVARELGRFGPATGMAPLVEAWVAAVGPEIARNAWPARLSRDGTMHVHTQDSIWAFELTTRAEEIRERLGEAAPRKLAFAPGPLPEPLEPPASRRGRAPVEPSAAHIAKADSLTRVIRDEELRKVVAKAAAASLAASDNDRSFC
jgi:Dna[CI] antecedent, DciA